MNKRTFLNLLASGALSLMIIPSAMAFANFNWAGNLT
jgi:hypothetical protein